MSQYQPEKAEALRVRLETILRERCALRNMSREATISYMFGYMTAELEYVLTHSSKARTRFANDLKYTENFNEQIKLGVEE